MAVTTSITLAQYLWSVELGGRPRSKTVVLLYISIIDKEVHAYGRDDSAGLCMRLLGIPREALTTFVVPEADLKKSASPFPKHARD